MRQQIDVCSGRRLLGRATDAGQGHSRLSTKTLGRVGALVCGVIVVSVLLAGCTGLFSQQVSADKPEDVLSAQLLTWQGTGH
jgi:hypothetical protein